jgi:hypothetical protein
LKLSRVAILPKVFDWLQSCTPHNGQEPVTTTILLAALPIYLKACSWLVRDAGHDFTDYLSADSLSHRFAKPGVLYGT